MNTLLLAAEGAEGRTINYFWLPHDYNEVIWGSLAFFVLMLILNKFARKPLMDGLAKRSSRIEEELAVAAQSKTVAEAERDRIKAALADSESEAAGILAEARQTAQRLQVELEAKAHADVALMRERAAADIETAKAQAIADLRHEAGRLALGATERVVQTSLDDAAQQQLIEQYISQVGSQN